MLNIRLLTLLYQKGEIVFGFRCLVLSFEVLREMSVSTEYIHSRESQMKREV